MGAYNCAGTLQRCVESILAQTFEDWELVICNDCSTDSTRQVAEALVASDPRVRLIENTSNSGLAHSLNHCLSVAEGEYIARMDADDIALPRRLQMQVEYLDANPDIAVVGGGVILYDEQGDRKTLLNPEVPDVRYMTSRIPFFHPTVMMRREAYERLGGYTDLKRTRRGQDMDLWFRFFAAGMRGYNIQEPLVKYHDGYSDVKRKGSLRQGWYLMQTKLIGFRLNRFPLTLYPYAFVPVVSALLPQKLVYAIHKYRN